MKTPDLTLAQLNEITSLRQNLHRFPELSGEEEATARRIVAFLQHTAPDEIITGLGGHGVAAVFTGSSAGPSVLIRCELDGLPITEDIGPDYRSEMEGKGHLCGHDGHMAIVCAVAEHLAANRPKSGRVVLLFQPAEETGRGARAVVSDPAFDRIAPDYAFALHNCPGVKMGLARLRKGPFSCASRGMHIRFTGRTAHASQPETGLSPAQAMSRFMTEVPAFSQGTVADENFALATLVHAQLGEPAFGVAPGLGHLMVTLRSVTDATMATLISKCETLAQTLAQEYGLACDIACDDIFSSTNNDEMATQIVEQALTNEGMPFETMTAPMRWSEDFGVFATDARSAMFLLGSGENQPQLHNPDFDFPDCLIAPGARIFVRIVKDILG